MPLARARSAPTKQTMVLPQIAQNSQNLLLGMTSHRFHRFAQIVRVRKILPQIAQIYTELLILGGALVSSAPTKQTKVLPQIAQNSQNLLLGRPPTDFTDLHRCC